MFKQMKDSYNIGKMMGETQLQAMSQEEKEKHNKKWNFLINGFCIFVVVVCLLIFAFVEGMWVKI